MKSSLIVMGRRYYSPELEEYVVAVRKGEDGFRFRRPSGDVVRIDEKEVCYASVDDFNMCGEIGDEAKMTWFFPWFDDETGTETNLEWDDQGRKRVKSFRNAIRDLYEGVDAGLPYLPLPKEYDCRFREFARGLGIV